MAKRGYKLQEFLAHSGKVNCLNIGKKACRLFVTGGDDQKVNVWSIGKPTPLMSLSGHTSPVESVAFDLSEVLVLAGASSGAIKQWDLEEAKMVRTLSGHRSNCSAVEFHPFGEFFASGSLDTNLRIWDIRKKACIHTYKGHTLGISTIKFTPDGRWVVSGGFDNVVKVWDLTAGKLLHDFKFHEGHIRSLDFHPLEFLLATGSADRTVKFWDLETFELIGSTRPEATEVRAITFHPDGRTLFCGLEESLKVYSWEPVICHDSVDMGWSTLGDLCIDNGKLLGCSYYQDSVGVWVADISLIEPHGGASTNDCLKLQRSSESVGVITMNSNLQCRSPDYDMKEIKNIYVDSSGGKPVTSQKAESLTPPKVQSHLYTKEMTKKQSRVIGTPPKPNDHAVNNSFIAPSIVPRDSTDGQDSTNSTSESINFSRTKRGMLLRPAHTRRSPNSKNGLERLLETVESGHSGNTMNSLDRTADSNSEIKIVPEDTKEDCCKEKNPIINTVTERSGKALSPQTPNNQETRNVGLGASKDSNSIKVVNGVAVVRGRTRSLVERFEKREQFDTNEDQATIIPSHAIPEVDKTPTVIPSRVIPEVDKTPIVVPSLVVPEVGNTSAIISSCVIPEENKSSFISSHVIPEVNPEVHKTPTNIYTHLITEVNKTRTVVSSRVIRDVDKTPTLVSSRVIREEDKTPTIVSSCVIPEVDTTPPVQVSESDSTSADDRDNTEDLMQTHDVFLSKLRSRLTKLQVVRHFWERGDIKGAIGAMKKLPDRSVQADVISVLMEKMDTLNLELFSGLLPVLLGLLNSKTDRHATLSMEMLMKLVAVFGPVIRSAVTARRGVGVDLHAEQRRECCNQCSLHLQQIKKILPSLVRRGGLVAKGALELNLVLQES